MREVVWTLPSWGLVVVGVVAAGAVIFVCIKAIRGADEAERKDVEDERRDYRGDDNLPD